MFAELPPSTGHKVLSAELMCNNLNVFISDSLSNNVAIVPVLDEIERIVRESILVPFANDWRHRTVSSRYLLKGRVRLDGQPQPTPPRPTSPTAAPSPPATPIPPHRVPRTPVSPLSRASTKQLFSPSLRADVSSASPDIFSNMSALSLDDLVGTAEQENSRKDKGKYTMPESSISRELRDFLESTSGLIPANSLSVIEYALENIGRGQWEGYLKTELQVNSGMAKALFLMMRHT